MHKHIILLILYWGVQTALPAQNIPLFHTTFYFTDAVGHRDSCVVGFDPMATDTADSIFGEKPLKNPFDSVFEVRAAFKDGHWTLNTGNLSKILVNPGEYTPLYPPPFDTCFVGGQAVFLIKAKYLPVQIAWDRNVFRRKPCVSASSLLLNRELFILHPPYFINKPAIACLAIDSTYVFDLASLPANRDFYFWIDYPRSDSVRDTIMGICINFSNSYGSSPVACVDSARIFLPAHQIYSQSATPGVHLYPNPGADYLRVEPLGEQDFEEWVLYSQDGRLVRRSAVDTDRFASTVISVQELPPGIYLLQLRRAAGGWVSSRFVKY